MNRKKTALFLSLTAAISLCSSASLAEDQTLEPITPSDYLIKDISSYVELGDLTELAATEYTYTITDDMVQEQINSELYSAAAENEVDRPAALGDIVYADLTSMIQGNEESKATDSTYVSLGDAEFGEEFDEAFIGTSAGDKLNFTITFDDDVWVEEWMGETVDFEAVITSVNEIVLPDLNDQYVADNTDYSSISEYEEAVRDSMTEEYADSSYAEAVEVLFEEAMDQSEFNGYPQDLYVNSQEETLSFYSMFAGTDDPDEICELFGITTDELNEEILSSVNRRLLISALCEKNNLVFSEEDYIDYVTESAESYGYENAVEFENENGRDALVWSLFESLAGKYLYENADISVEEYVPSEEDEYVDFDFDDTFEDYEFETEAE